MTKTLILAASAALTLMTTGAPAGSPGPTLMRIVTMDGRTGPAAYIAVEGRYRFVEALPSDGSRLAALSLD